jgi:hypothetical protein
MTEQKTWIVEWFLETNSIVTVKHQFKNQYKYREAPTRNTLKMVEQFRATGNVTGKKRGGSKPRVRMPNTVGTIRASVASSPTWKSVQQPQKMRYRLRQHGAYFELIYACIHTRSMSSSLWQLCAEKSGQGLRRNSMITCSRTLTLWNTFGSVTRPTFTSWVTLTDKTCVSGAHSIHIKFTNPLCTQKALVWCAVSAQGLIGPFMLEDYVAAENYAMMLDSFFLPQLRQRTCSLHAQWFQQDGARPHTTPEVLEFLHSKFQHHIVSNRFPQQFQCGFSWPPCSPGLKPCDYILWGCLKDRVFSSSPWTLPELMERIKESCAELCIMSSSGSRVSRGSHQACHTQRYTYVKF